MKVIATLISIILMVLSAKAQTKEIPPLFSNQGEQENYWTKQLFENRYEKQVYDRFKGHIVVINEDVIKYNDEVLKINNTSTALKSIFKKGLFYPGIITGSKNAGFVERQQEIDSLRKIDSTNSSLFDTDILTIADVEELKFLSTSPQVKRFRFWLFVKGFANPNVYFIELTNTKATEQTTTEPFIEGATLTFFKKGWLII